MNSKHLEAKLKEFYKIQRDYDQVGEIYREIKRELETLIIKENMVNKKFSVGDRLICYKESEQTPGITKAYISQCLQEYFNESPKEADAVMSYIWDNRQKKSRYGLEVRRKEGQAHPLPPD